MIDCLVSADLSVTDPDGVAALFVEKLGFPPWRPSWIHDWTSRGYRAYFLRPQLDRAVAPTAVEVIGPHPELGYDRWSPGLRGPHEQQGGRPMKTHSTVFSVPDPEEYVKRLADSGIPFEYDPGSGELAFGKLWVGRTAGPGYSYDPAFDAGLFIELVPTSSMRLPAAAFEPISSSRVEPGQVARVAWRSFVVDDIDASVRTVTGTLGWEPSEIRRSDIDGCLVATFIGRLPGSAGVELLQPIDGDRPVGRYLGAYGEGAYRITLAVNGLEAASRALDERRVRHTIEEARGQEDGRIRIEPASFGGLFIELVGF